MFCYKNEMLDEITDQELISFIMEEIIPIVARLTQRYTGFESTSVTFEKARQHG